jgi:hypothetical protein
MDFRRFPARKRAHFFMNLVIGLAIVIGLHFLQETRWGESTLDKFMDLFISTESGKAGRVQKGIGDSPILFVDIDHETYKRWGEPLITPRDKLADILRILHDAGAGVIVLDILLEGDDCLKENDQKLLDVLRRIQLDERSPTKIILPQRIGFQGELKKSLFDVLFEPGPSPGAPTLQKLYRATPVLSATGADNIVRYWNLYERYRCGDGRPEIIWGYPIAAVLLAVEGSLKGLDAFGEILKKEQGRPERDHERLRLSTGKIVKLPHEKSHLYLQRLRFLLVPKRSAKDAFGEPDIGAQGNLFQTVVGFEELNHYRDAFKGKIVVVGNSSPDVGDIHKTPVGDMAGMYILGNSIYTILAKEQPSPPPVWLSIAIEVAVIILAAYLFLYFTSLLAQVIASVVILLLFGYIGYLYFLRTGIFLNFVFAIVGMGFHETTKDIEEAIEKKGMIKYVRNGNT